MKKAIAVLLFLMLGLGLCPAALAEGEPDAQTLKKLLEALY